MSILPRTHRPPAWLVQDDAPPPRRVWRADEEATLRWLDHLGGEATTDELATNILLTPEQTSRIMLRLLWRGEVTMTARGAGFRGSRWRRA